MSTKRPTKNSGEDSSDYPHEATTYLVLEPHDDGLVTDVYRVLAPPARGTMEEVQLTDNVVVFQPLRKTEIA